MALRTSLQQLQYLFVDLNRINRRPWRWSTCWFEPAGIVIVSYRLERSLYLLLGGLWPLIRALLAPIRFLLRPWLGRSTIHYEADIGPGFRVLHPELGVVISAKTIAGRNLILTGGNCIGGRSPLSNGDLCIGDNVQLGANAVILGPVRLGDRIQIGAGAVVVHDCEGNCNLVGVPARALVQDDDK